MLLLEDQISSPNPNSDSNSNSNSNPNRERTTSALDPIEQMDGLSLNLNLNSNLNNNNHILQVNPGKIKKSSTNTSIQQQQQQPLVILENDEKLENMLSRLLVLESRNSNGISDGNSGGEKVEILGQLADQVTKAMAYQQMMKDEVEKLQKRVYELEKHNKAIATMILPTLVKLNDSITYTPTTTTTTTNNNANNTSDSDGNRTFTRPSRRLESNKNNTKIASKTTTSSPSRTPAATTTTTTTGIPSSPRRIQNHQNSPNLKKIDCKIPKLPGLGVKNVAKSDKSSTSLRSLTPLPLPQTCISSNRPKSSEVHSKSNNSSPSRKPPNYRNNNLFSDKFQNKSSTYSGIPRNQNQNQSQTSPKPMTKSLGPSGSGYGQKNEEKTQKTDSKLPILNKRSSSIPTKSTKSSTKAESLGNRSDIVNLTFVKESKNEQKVVILTQNSSFLTQNGVENENNGQILVTEIGTKIGTKDEGYSTMSSEALAEQENNVKNVTSSTTTTCSTTMTSNSKCQIPKSQTFNTFREIIGYHNNNIAAVIRRNDEQVRKNSSLPKIVKKSEDFCRKPAAIARKDHNSVKIIRGRPYDYDLCDSTTTGDGDSTILYEDSDDSDILFLPLELSTSATAGSSNITSTTTSTSTMVPDTYSLITSPTGSSGDSTTMSMSNSLSSSSKNKNSKNLRDQSSRRKNYPLRRSKGDDVVKHLNTTSKNGQHFDESSTNTDDTSGPEDEIAITGEIVDVEERELIEKWMIMENGRNAENEEEFLWDWDGIKRSNHQSHNNSLVSPNSDYASRTIDSSTWSKSKSRDRKKSKKSPLDGHTDQQTPTPAPPLQCHVLNDELINEMAITITGGPEVLCDDGNLDINLIESPPPHVEFTPEFYTLVNYDINQEASGEQKQLIKRGEVDQELDVVSHGNCSSSKRKNVNKMDDKVSQTDFISSSSSQENFSNSEESELFNECQNCLEVIKKLVMVTDREDCTSSTTMPRTHEENYGVDQGYPTTWLNVPKGLPTNEVDRIFEILSSSESEDVLSPPPPAPSSSTSGYYPASRRY